LGKAAFITTKMCLRIGDVVDFVVTASDPLGANLQYSLSVSLGNEDNWQDSNVMALTIEKKNVRKEFVVSLYVRSPREYHAKEE
jgi:hypothetical protein